MMARTQITLEPELHRRARERASALGISLAEYVRRLVVRDLGGVKPKPDPRTIFDLGRSDGSDVSNNKRQMIADAFASEHRNPRRRRSPAR